MIKMIWLSIRDRFSNGNYDIIFKDITTRVRTILFGLTFIEKRLKRVKAPNTDNMWYEW